MTVTVKRARRVVVQSEPQSELTVIGGTAAQTVHSDAELEVSAGNRVDVRTGDVGPRGLPGLPGEPGEPGQPGAPGADGSGVFVQMTQPSTSAAYEWWQTNAEGELVTLWVNVP